MSRLVVSLVLIAAIVGAITGIVSGLIIKSQIDASNAQQRATLFDAQVKSCKRQNVRTAATNKNALATYRFDTLFAEALTHPTRRQTAQEQRLSAKFRSRLEDTVASLTWTSLNFACRANPLQVELPVRFADRAPTASELTPPH